MAETYNRMKGNRQLSSLLSVYSNEEVLEEVIYILSLLSPDFDTKPVSEAFIATVKLFKGIYPGYRECNTEYHDLRHTTDTFLAMARLTHGAVLNGMSFTDRNISVSLIAALLHDAGYVQEEHDREGTGAKYTVNHVKRSMDLLKYIGVEFGLCNEEITAGRMMIQCTDLTEDIPTITFSSNEVELLSKMLGAADLLAQMADRMYLEKLLFLYREFKEAGVGGYEDEVDLLKRTVGFYDFIAHRLEAMLDGNDRFMISHFESRWHVNENLYQKSIEQQRNYLKHILEKLDSDPRDYLRRGGIIEKIRREYGGED
jgi:hypothetical protein